MENLKISIEKVYPGTLNLWIEGGDQGSSLVGKYDNIKDLTKAIEKLWKVK